MTSPTADPGDPTEPPEADADPDAAAEAVPSAPVRRGSDPERGFRGVMSGALILQAITVLLGLPLASSDRVLKGWELAAILGLSLGCVVACAFVKRTWIVPLVVVLQVVAIGCWVIHPALGVMGLIFALVWGVLFYFHAELGRRSAAGVLPAQQAEDPRGGPSAG